MEANGNELIFSTGQSISCNEGIIGINKELETYEGYDGCIETQCLNCSLTKKEKIELCDYAIGLWEKYKSEVT